MSKPVRRAPNIPNPTHRARRTPREGGRSAYTLIEVLIVVTILGIVAAIVVPAGGTTGATKVRAAARLLVADIEFAQNESIAHPDDPRLLVIDQANSRYWVAAVSDPATAINDPAGSGTMLVQFGSARAAYLGGVTVQSYALGGDAELRFDGLGQPDQTTAASVVLECEGHTLTITVSPTSGEVSAS